MNREIKFKAYIKAIGWVVVVERINFDCRTVEVDLSAGQGDTSEYSFDEVELMQYTGLKDKNGNGIYEGDILEICGWEGEYYKVYHEDTAFRTKALFKETSCCSREKVLSDLLECKIIGDIYKDPELLEV